MGNRLGGRNWSCGEAGTSRSLTEDHTVTCLGMRSEKVISSEVSLIKTQYENNLLDLEKQLRAKCYN